MIIILVICSISMECLMERSQDCINPLAGINIPSNGLLFPYMGDNLLDDICGNYKAVERCVDTSMVHCSEKQRVAISTKNNVLKYLCTEGYLGYKNTRSCFDDKTLLDRVRACNSTFTAEVSEIQQVQDQTFSIKKENLCICMKDLITCIKDSTHDVCGSEASAWISNIKTRMLSGSLSHICPIAQTNHLPTILAITFAVFVAVIVIGLAFVIIYKKVQSEDNNTKIPTASENRTDKNSTRGDRHLRKPLFDYSSKGSSHLNNDDSDDVILGEVNKNGFVKVKHSKTEDSSCTKIEESSGTFLSCNGTRNELVNEVSEV